SLRVAFPSAQAWSSCCWRASGDIGARPAAAPGGRGRGAGGGAISVALLVLRPPHPGDDGLHVVVERADHREHLRLTREDALQALDAIRRGAQPRERALQFLVSALVVAGRDAVQMRARGEGLEWSTATTGRGRRLGEADLFTGGSGCEELEQRRRSQRRVLRIALAALAIELLRIDEPLADRARPTPGPEWSRRLLGDLRHGSPSVAAWRGPLSPPALREGCLPGPAAHSRN